MFDTATLQDTDTYAAWREGGGDLKRVFDTLPLQPFACSAHWLSLGTTDLGFAQFTSQQWTRTPAMAARDDYDQMVINCRFAGGARGDMAGRTLDAGAGTIIINDLAQPQTHISEASDSVALVLQRAEAEAIFGPVRALHGHVVAPHHASIVLSFMDALRRNAHHYPITAAAALGETVVDLITMAIKTSLHEDVKDIVLQEKTLGVRVRYMIERELGSPTLNVTRLGRMLGISRASLYRVMEAEGGVQAYIAARRLEKVAEALRATGPQQTLATLAQRWGFCDAAYLGRSFREAFGMTPGDYREVHRRR